MERTHWRFFRNLSYQTGAVVCLWCAAVEAQSAGPTKAESEFDQQLQVAAARYENEQYQDAILALQNAYALQPLPRLLCNIGQAYRKLGNHRAAVAQYELCLKNDPEIDLAYRAEVDSYIADRRQQWAAKSRQAAAENPTTGAVGRTVDKSTVAQPCPSPAQTPVYKKWWLWTIVGVVVAGGAVGLGVGLTQRAAPTLIPTPFYDLTWK